MGKDESRAIPVRGVFLVDGKITSTARDVLPPLRQRQPTVKREKGDVSFSMGRAGKGGKMPISCRGKTGPERWSQNMLELTLPRGKKKRS